MEIDLLVSRSEISKKPNIMSNYALSEYVEDLRRITSQTSDESEIMQQVGPLAQRFVADRSWVKPEYYQGNEAQGFGAFLLHEEPDHSLAVFLVNWLPGRGTPPHDHGTWAVVAGLEGTERNIRYSRLDDGAKPDHARLEVKDDFNAAEGELVCMKTGGIHKVVNETESMTLSVHTYGRHINHTNRSQFDLESDTRKEFRVEVD